MVSLSKCIPWMTVGLAGCVAIVTLNLCTIIVFTRNRHLRKRSTYLVINLAVIDIFVGLGAVYYLFFHYGIVCNLWNWRPTEVGIRIFMKVKRSLLSRLWFVNKHRHHRFRTGARDVLPI